MPPTSTNGKICYVEIPAVDIERSADFYSKVFGWRIKKRGDGSTAFDDTTGQVSGTWVVGRTVLSTPGPLIYIMVDSVAKTIDAVIEEGGRIERTIGENTPGIGRFYDPAGNVFGLYQESSH
jgi:predicted enzyme related to lactoylglutathione lyase